MILRAFARGSGYVRHLAGAYVPPLNPFTNRYMHTPYSDTLGNERNAKTSYISRSWDFYRDLSTAFTRAHHIGIRRSLNTCLFTSDGRALTILGRS